MEWIPHIPCFDHGPYVFSGDGSRKLNSPLSEYVISMIVIPKKHTTKRQFLVSRYLILTYTKIFHLGRDFSGFDMITIDLPAHEAHIYIYVYIYTHLYRLTIEHDRTMISIILFLIFPTLIHHFHWLDPLIFFDKRHPRHMEINSLHLMNGEISVKGGINFTDMNLGKL